jgi:cytochrome c oxidase subunit 2
VLAFLTLAFAASPESTPDLAYGVCVHCHGAHGEGRPELGTPRLGDLSEAYIARQLAMFRDGGRGAHPGDPDAKPMAAIARGLPSDARIAELAAFASALDPEHRDRPDASPDQVAAGRRLYASCAACHGTDGRGNEEVGAPDLLFQDPTYLARQLRNYRDGRRGGPAADPSAQVMASLAKGLADEDIDGLVAYVGSLRPDRPALEDYPVTVSREDGLAAFADIFAVATHPRCMNCHPAGDAPLHGEAGDPHPFGVTRFSPLQGLHCSTCHSPLQVGDGQAPLPPADPIWSLAPAQMVFEDRTPAQLCAQLKDPAINGGRGHVASTAHIAHDHLLITSWHKGRPAPPLSHEALVERFETWGRAGGPCPED